MKHSARFAWNEQINERSNYAAISFRFLASWAGTFFWLEHSVSMIQSCSPCLLNTYIRIVLTHLSPIYISSNTQRNKHKMLIASCIFNQLGWWSTALGSQPNPVWDEVIFATVWITSHRRSQKWCSLGQSSYSLFF